MTEEVFSNNTLGNGDELAIIAGVTLSPGFFAPTFYPFISANRLVAALACAFMRLLSNRFG